VRRVHVDVHEGNKVNALGPGCEFHKKSLLTFIAFMAFTEHLSTSRRSRQINIGHNLLFTIMKPRSRQWHILKVIDYVACFVAQTAVIVYFYGRTVAQLTRVYCYINSVILACQIIVMTKEWGVEYGL
jgi:hypothetical protein